MAPDLNFILQSILSVDSFIWWAPVTHLWLGSKFKVWRGWNPRVERIWLHFYLWIFLYWILSAIKKEKGNILSKVSLSISVKQCDFSNCPKEWMEKHAPRLLNDRIWRVKVSALIQLNTEAHLPRMTTSVFK